MIETCDARPNVPHKDKYVQCGLVGVPPTVWGGWDKDPECSRWARCMGYYTP